MENKVIDIVYNLVIPLDTEGYASDIIPFEYLELTNINKTNYEKLQ